jgi:hypothetical protein
MAGECSKIWRKRCSESRTAFFPPAVVFFRFVIFFVLTEIADLYLCGEMCHNYFFCHFEERE